jgi:hypothetical protein
MDCAIIQTFLGYVGSPVEMYILKYNGYISMSLSNHHPNWFPDKFLYKVIMKLVLPLKNKV